MSLRESILAALKRDHVSFAELSRIEGFKGDLEIYLDDSNIVIWSHVSQEAATILAALRDQRVMHYEPTTILVYLIDGCSLNYPLAKQARSYRKPHWLPVVMRPGPSFGKISGSVSGSGKRK